MTWLLFLFGVMGPAIVGQFADEGACNKAVQERTAMALHENEGKPPPPLYCVGVQDDPPAAPPDLIRGAST